MWLFRRSKKEENYEEILLKIEERISQAEEKKEKSTINKHWLSTTFVVYSSVAWGVFVAGFWYNIKINKTFISTETYSLCLSISIFSPVALLILSTFNNFYLLFSFYSVYYLNKIFSYFYDRKIKKLDSEIKKLIAEQKEKILELKKKTEFDSTKRLIEKYDKSKPLMNVNTSQQNKFVQQKGNNTNQLTQRHQKQLQANPQQIQLAQQKNTQQIKPIAQSYINTQNKSGVVPIVQKKNIGSPKPWLENIIDRLVGDEQISNNKYALICRSCYSHNGLVLEEEIETIQYTCPKCGAFNPSKISSASPAIKTNPTLNNKHNGLGFASPNSSLMSAPKFNLPQAEKNSKHNENSINKISPEIRSAEKVEELKSEPSLIHALGSDTEENNVVEETTVDEAEEDKEKEIDHSVENKETGSTLDDNEDKKAKEPVSKRKSKVASSNSNTDLKDKTSTKTKK
ncbi:Protein lunapark [Smittium culicis]|uniref:Endoplasmic reticulum junction formation protein lunapark n=1 Tax=Smittium culicis TaxID=133412 RepID=A0A1R1XF94_9FUNG|nr:Protein lunapark [Smittium culicis]